MVKNLSLLFIRHAERIDTVMGKDWVKNCFEDSGKGITIADLVVCLLYFAALQSIALHSAALQMALPSVALHSAAL